jgi:predicted transcriptional regulator
VRIEEKHKEEMNHFSFEKTENILESYSLKGPDLHLLQD